MTIILIIALLLIFAPMIGWLLLAGGVVVGAVAAVIGLISQFAVPLGIVGLVIFFSSRKGR